MTKKIIITDYVDHISPYDLVGSLSNVYNHIGELVKQYGEEATLSWDANYWEDYATEASPRFDINVRREETDEEYTNRTKKQKVDDERRLELLQLEVKRLKKIIGVENE